MGCDRDNEYYWQWKDGYNAYLAGDSLEDNPYRNEEYECWKQGWQDAAWDD